LKLIRHNISVLFFLGAISGCVVKTPQLDSAKAIVGDLLKLGEASAAKANQWSVKFGDQGRIVDVYEENGLYIFVSDSGDIVAFDGWHIRSFAGFGVNSIQQIIVDGINVQFSSADGSSIVQCEPWESMITDSGHTYWKQECQGQTRPSQIHVSPDGSIVEIDQVVTESQDRMLIRRL
jgi:hypothetical protein